MIKYLKLFRAHQYIKNLLIFTPLFFAADLFNKVLFVECLFAVLAFCFTASSIYIFNDLCDINYDRKHCFKKERILASGQITVKKSIYLIIILFFAGIFIMLLQSPLAFTILLVYVILNVLYSLYLKHIAIVDISIIAFFYIIRLFVGSVVCNIPLTHWIIVITFVFAIFIALSKRRNDILIYLKTGQKTREVINGYNLDFINCAMSVSASVAIVSYLLYVLSPTIIHKFNNNYVYITAFWVIVAILRYLQVLFVDNKIDDPVKIFCTDIILIIIFILWILTFGLIIYC